jgi:hypothetical protein
MSCAAAKYLTYCWPRMFTEQPGLGHMKEIARTLMIEAAMLNRTAALPPLRSNPIHNPDKPGLLNWADYYDWSKLNCHDFRWRNKRELGAYLRNHRSVQIITENHIDTPVKADASLVIRQFSDPNIFGQWLPVPKINTIDPLLDEPAFSDLYPASIHQAAAQVVAEIGVPSGVVHIRRGDLAGPETEPGAVIEYLHAKGACKKSRIFGITNERSPNYFSCLRQEFPGMVFEHEVDWIQRILLQSKDNYIVFRIGKCLQKKYDGLALGTLRFMKSTVTKKTLYPGERIISGIVRRITPQEIVTADWLNNQINGSA